MRHWVFALAVLLLAGCREPDRVDARDYDAFWLWAGVAPQPVLDQARTIYILDGEVTIDGRSCGPGTQIVLPKGAAIGPLIAGPQGCTFIESYAGDVTARDVDPAEYDALIAARGITVIPKAHLKPESGEGR